MAVVTAVIVVMVVVVVVVVVVRMNHDSGVEGDDVVVVVVVRMNHGSGVEGDDGGRGGGVNHDSGVGGVDGGSGGGEVGQAFPLAATARVRANMKVPKISSLCVSIAGPLPALRIPLLSNIKHPQQLTAHLHLPDTWRT